MDVAAEAALTERPSGGPPARTHFSAGSGYVQMILGDVFARSRIPGIIAVAVLGAGEIRSRQVVIYGHRFDIKMVKMLTATLKADDESAVQKSALV